MKPDISILLNKLQLLLPTEAHQQMTIIKRYKSNARRAQRETNYLDLEGPVRKALYENISRKRKGKANVRRDICMIKGTQIREFTSHRVTEGWVSPEQ